MKRDEQPIIGESPAFLSVLEEVSRAAALDRPVLIVGERGTGKELIAERLHFLSPRWDQALVKLNCAAISNALLESELFGHEAGAYTDASARRAGRFERADGGTLFLDELATTSMNVQEKILRVIEYGQFERLGGNRTLEVDVRVIGATNVDLPSLAERGEFRADLLDRLAFDVITLPPLRDRREDILPLAEHFAIRMTREMGRELFAGFSSASIERLLNFPWPGNVRQLKNVVERAVYRLDDAEEPVSRIQFDPFESPWRPVERSSENRVFEPASGSIPDDLRAHLDQIEKDCTLAALEANDARLKPTAKQLGLSYDQLRGILRKHGIKTR
ncbi:phage shock protein operon transcriptional activator [Wenzhouxiangella marina]|uniref:ATPase AAA n=1 Tax=Wenzhouxiangella marina TaxID=1579979 RepID=A0A0K0XVN2_9GAMM|nr:phage shock protein operon transcriptional activator [Wenzhouxiangella marina]AKS41720.1 ATPase AAA [Wenzhouxiangella marina]MBB6086518.1 psp operon transcriptional activator [Wenzhouxiangella marina]